MTLCLFSFFERLASNRLFITKPHKTIKKRYEKHFVQIQIYVEALQDRWTKNVFNNVLFFWSPLNILLQYLTRETRISSVFASFQESRFLCLKHFQAIRNTIETIYYKNKEIENCKSNLQDVFQQFLSTYYVSCLCSQKRDKLNMLLLLNRQEKTFWSNISDSNF